MNEGQTAVTNESLKPSCGCTTAELEKKTYAPGEKGEVRARFDIGQRVGVQSKSPQGMDSAALPSYLERRLEAAFDHVVTETAGSRDG